MTITNDESGLNRRQTAEPETVAVPLCVDLDGTVTRTDMTWESLVELARRNPLYLLAALGWLFRGRACLKSKLAQRCDVDVTSLPYDAELLAFLASERQAKREVLLVTASDTRVAVKVAAHLGVFSEVLASDGRTNLRGDAKAAKLVERFGEKGFDYAGNSSVDLPVWERARGALVVNGSRGLADRARRRSKVSHVFSPRKPWWRPLIQALEPCGWLKSGIIFAPLLLTWNIAKPGRLLETMLAFVAFSLCGSGMSMLEALLDLGLDRSDPQRRLRPFASGELPLWIGLMGVGLLTTAGAILASWLSQGVAMAYGMYFLLALGYAWRFRRNQRPRVLCAAALYLVLLIAGWVTAGLPVLVRG